MSLTSFINDSSVFQEFIRAIIPTRNDFYTFSGKAPFSKDYHYLAPNSGLTQFESSVSGVAFDYMARFKIAQTISNETSKNAYQNIIAQQGLKRISNKVPSKVFKRLEKRYDESIEAIREFVVGKDNIFKVVEFVIYLSKLELIFRSGGILPKEGAESILISEKGIVEDLISLYAVFEENFIKQHVSKNSRVIYNPHFGKYSNLIGGADADIIIDDTLYDLKTLVKRGYKWQHCAQIISYFFMNVLNASTMGNTEVCNIRYLALYQARYGEICIFDTEKFGDKLEIHINKFREFFDRLESDRNFYWECFLSKPKSNISINDGDIKKY